MLENIPGDVGSKPETQGEFIPPATYEELLAATRKQMEARCRAQLWVLTAAVATSKLTPTFKREMLEQTLKLADIFSEGLEA